MQNDSLATLLARLEGILGPVPQRLLSQGRYTHRFYTCSGALFERNARTVSSLSRLLSHLLWRPLAAQCLHRKLPVTIALHSEGSSLEQALLECLCS